MNILFYELKCNYCYTGITRVTNVTLDSYPRYLKAQYCYKCDKPVTGRVFSILDQQFVPHSLYWVENRDTENGVNEKEIKKKPKRRNMIEKA